MVTRLRAAVTAQPEPLAPPVTSAGYALPAETLRSTSAATWLYPVTVMLLMVVVALLLAVTVYEHHQLLTACNALASATRPTITCR